MHVPQKVYSLYTNGAQPPSRVGLFPFLPLENTHGPLTITYGQFYHEGFVFSGGGGEAAAVQPRVCGSGVRDEDPGAGAALAAVTQDLPGVLGGVTPPLGQVAGG